MDCFCLIAKAGTVRRDINTERESQPELETEDRDVHWSVAVFESAAKDAETQRNSMPVRSWCSSSGAANCSGGRRSFKSRNDGLL